MTEEALAAFKTVPGLEVLDAHEASERTARNTIGASRLVHGRIRAQTLSQVQEVVRIAAEHHLSLYPISVGHNWGYGSALPAADGCVILDLSRMNRIHECNEELGYVTLEPGVTQQQLHDFLLERNLSFMVPTTGGGPSCSIIGNALEKGFGITPHEDHFGAVLSIKAVLPSGEIYRSVIAEFGGERSDTVFKWKLGPYLDGLFVQGNFGIVVQATIALVQKPEDITQFLIFIEEKNFEAALPVLSSVKRHFGTLLGGVNIMNKRRLLSMFESRREWLGEHVLAEMHIRELAHRHGFPDWIVTGGIYSTKEVTPGVIRRIKKEFAPVAKHSIFLNRGRLALYARLLGVVPIPRLKKIVQSATQALTILEGTPGEVALPLAYIKNPKKSAARDNLSPDEDECGLIWFSPLLPIDASLVRDFTQEVTRICIATDIEPLVTLTAISERCFDSTIPILFDVRDEEDRRNAAECHRLLLALSREMGIYPYRIDIDTMRETYDKAEGPAFGMLESIKRALDPHAILAPGRYGKDTRKEIHD